jgi:peptidoglycan/xylan/chitin deacetylase (PgdA/CDA1 family)
MKFVSPLLKRVVYPSLAKAGVFRRTRNSGLAVLTYHGIRPREYRSVDASFDGNLITDENFRKQLQLLKARYYVISPEDVLAWCETRAEFPPRAILLTCDDGLLNNLTDMLPMLQEEELRCLFFVTGASARQEKSTLWYEELFLILFHTPPGRFEISCDGVKIATDLGTQDQRRTFWWDTVKQLSKLEAESRKSFLRTARDKYPLNRSAEFAAGDSAARRFHLLNCEQLRQLASAGMTIGAHTMSHPMLSQLPVESARAEIAESKVMLESLLGKPVWALAYPFGDAQSVTPQVVKLAEETGYAAAFLNYGGGLGTNSSRYAIPRIHVTAEMGLSEFEAHIAGFHAVLQRFGRRDRTDLQRREVE